MTLMRASPPVVVGGGEELLKGRDENEHWRQKNRKKMAPSFVQQRGDCPPTLPSHPLPSTLRRLSRSRCERRDHDSP
jgi:hypothetical protein